MFDNFSNRLYQFFESRSGHWTIGIIVIFNAIILGVQTTRFVSDDVAEILHHLDQFILGFFVVELLTKIIVSRGDFFRNKWNIFDFIIVAGSLVESNDYLTILRAFRTLHLMSLTDAMPKTKHIIGGLSKALPGISNVLAILLLFFYIACVIGVYLFKDSGVENFQHIGLAMKSMFQVMTGDDWTNMMKAIEAHDHPYAWVYFISFYIIIVFIILNLFIGVVVGSMQAAEEEIYADQNEDGTLKAILELKAQIKLLDKKLDAVQNHSSSAKSTPPNRPKHK